MTLRKAIMYAMNSYPEFYLIDPEVLFVEATNKVSVDHVFSKAEMDAELNRLEGERLCASQREYQILKWSLTGAGRSWIKNYRGA